MFVCSANQRALFVRLRDPQANKHVHEHGNGIGGLGIQKGVVFVVYDGNDPRTPLTAFKAALVLHSIVILAFLALLMFMLLV